MDDFWEMYSAYCSKKDTDSLEKTPWGRSPCDDYEVPEGGKGNGQYWLEQCYHNVDIRVVGKRANMMSMSVSNNACRRLRHRKQKSLRS